MNLWQFFQQNRDQIFSATLEHLALVGAAMLIAVLIGVPAGILITRRKWLEKPIIGLAKEREEIFRPGIRDPLVIDHASGAIRLLQRIRDEASAVSPRATFAGRPRMAPSGPRAAATKFASPPFTCSAQIASAPRDVGTTSIQTISSVVRASSVASPRP